MVTWVGGWSRGDSCAAVASRGAVARDPRFSFACGACLSVMLTHARHEHLTPQTAEDPLKEMGGWPGQTCFQERKKCDVGSRLLKTLLARARLSTSQILLNQGEDGSFGWSPSILPEDRFVLPLFKTQLKGNIGLLIELNMS